MSAAVNYLNNFFNDPGFNYDSFSKDISIIFQSFLDTKIKEYNINKKKVLRVDFKNEYS